MRKALILLVLAGAALACGEFGVGGGEKKEAQKASAEKLSPAEIEKLIKQLGSDDRVTREAALEALLKIGEDALPFLKAASESAELEVRRLAAALHARIYRPWIQKRAERAGKYGVDVYVERMVNRRRDLTDTEWDVFVAFVDKIRAQTKINFGPDRILMLPLRFDVKIDDPLLRNSLQTSRFLAPRIEMDETLAGSVAICSGEVKTSFGTGIVFANGNVDCGTAGGLIVCDGDVSMSLANGALIIARGAVKIRDAGRCTNTTIMDDYRGEIAGLRFFSVRDLGVHLSGGGKDNLDMVTVATLQKGSALEKAGLKGTDTISSINGRKITHPDQARRLFRSAMGEGHIEIGFKFDKKRIVRVEIPW